MVIIPPCRPRLKLAQIEYKLRMHLVESQQVHVCFNPYSSEVINLYFQSLEIVSR